MAIRTAADFNRQAVADVEEAMAKLFGGGDAYAKQRTAANGVVEDHLAGRLSASTRAEVGRKLLGSGVTDLGPGAADDAMTGRPWLRDPKEGRLHPHRPRLRRPKGMVPFAHNEGMLRQVRVAGQHHSRRDGQLLHIQARQQIAVQPARRRGQRLGLTQEALATQGIQEYQSLYNGYRDSVKLINPADIFDFFGIRPEMAINSEITQAQYTAGGALSQAQLVNQQLSAEGQASQNAASRNSETAAALAKIAVSGYQAYDSNKPKTTTTTTSPAVGVQQGKFNQIDYGVVYWYDGRFSRELLTSPGEHAIFTAGQVKAFYNTKALEKALKRKIALSKDETGAERNRPWTDDLTAEQRARFDAYLLSFGERAAPAGAAGDDGGTDGGGSRAGSVDLRHGAIGRRIGGKVAYRQRGRQGPGRSTGNDQDGVRRDLTADEFAAAGKANREGHPFGTSVDVYPAADYADYDLIMIERGGETATASISTSGEIGSVTKSARADKSMVDAAFEAAIATGKVKWLNGFDTILPGIYAAKGFAPVTRLKWDDEQQPAGWDKATYQKFNGGQPDVVFMRYTGTPVEYRRGDAPVVASWDDAVAAATRLKSPGADQYSLPARNGRAQPVDADVMTPQGPVAIGALRVGDLISDPDGGTQRVRGTFPQGVRAVFQIRLEDGRTAPATADHLWLARRENGEAVVVTTARLLEGLARGERWSLPVAAEN
ncbi:MAG: Hint domain-containing protein [Verrucomicrobiota bacterium]